MEDHWEILKDFLGVSLLSESTHGHVLCKAISTCLQGSEAQRVGTTKTRNGVGR